MNLKPLALFFKPTTITHNSLSKIFDLFMFAVLVDHHGTTLDPPSTLNFSLISFYLPLLMTSTPLFILTTI
jgi:hypothetical protein